MSTPYLDPVSGFVMWVPNDPDNPHRRMAKRGDLVECDPSTGAPLKGETDRVEKLRAETFERESAAEAKGE